MSTLDQGNNKFAARAAFSEEDNALPCAEKMAFDTQAEAEVVGTAAEWQHGGALKAYQCRYCHLWHLSSAS